MSALAADVDAVKVVVMSRPLTAFAVVLVALIVSAGGGCSEDCSTIEPAYAGDANDEVWRVLIGARDDASSGGDAATITAPAADAVVDDVPTVTWDSPLKVGVLLPHRAQGRRRAQPALFERFSALFIPAAHAHLAPITSDVYFVEVDVPGRTCPVSLLTTNTEAAFIAEGGGERTIRLMSAFVTQNRITEGPFLASPIAFSIK